MNYTSIHLIEKGRRSKNGLDIFFTPKEFDEFRLKIVKLHHDDLYKVAKERFFSRCNISVNTKKLMDCTNFYGANIALVNFITQPNSDGDVANETVKIIADLLKNEDDDDIVSLKYGTKIADIRTILNNCIKHGTVLRWDYDFEDSLCIG